MRKFLSNRLFRSSIITKLEAAGSELKKRVLSADDFDQELRKKLLEEAAEVAAAKTPSELLEELADVFEVVDTLCSLYNVQKDVIFAIQAEKRIKKGIFKPDTFVEIAAHPAGSAAEQYFVASGKHPEIVE